MCVCVCVCFRLRMDGWREGESEREKIESDIGCCFVKVTWLVVMPH